MTINIKFDFSKATKVLSLPQTLDAFEGAVPFGETEATVQGDFNGDQIQDLFSVQGALLGRVLTPVIVQLGDGQGGYTDGTSSIFGDNIPEITFAPRIFASDFNGDGKTDIFIPDFGIDLPPFDGGQNRLFLTSSEGMIDASSNLPQRLDLSHGASVGDIDSDGDIDLVVNNLMFDTRQVHILLNDGLGGFTEAQERVPANFLGQAVQSHAGHTWSRLHDVDLDGSPDLILGTWDNTGRPSEIYLNNGEGDFSASSAITLPSSGIPTEVILDIDPIDLNGDALPDLILSVTNGGSNTTFYTHSYLQVLINDGNGQFVDDTSSRLLQQNPETGYWIKFVEVIDFNGDGASDLLTTAHGTSRDNGSKIYQNDGNGNFTDVFSIPGSNSTLNGSDLNGDNKIDLIASREDSLTSTQVNSTFVLFNETPSIPETVENGVYRFFNTQTGTHFYSASEIERDSIINNLDNFNFESAAFKAATEANGPTASVFRFFNTETGTHFFTQSTVERDSVIENLPSFNLEGEAYLGYTEEVAGSTPLYRFFNTQTGTHFYTAAEAEKDSIIANLPSFNFEGTAYWVDPVMG